MTYASLLEAYGYERFWADARAAGATSLIVADLPVDDAAPSSIPRVQLVAPTTPAERIELAAERTDGWLYLVSVTGTTGAAPGCRRSCRTSSSGRGRSRTCRCSPASASRRPRRPPRRPRSPTASSSAAARSSWPTRSGPGALGEFVASLRAALDAL